MDQQYQKFKEILNQSITKCTSNNLALSGGLDSSVLAYCIQKRNPKTFAIITEDFVATDLTYCQMIAANLNLSLEMIRVNTEKIISSIEDTIKILGNFNDIEIRNSLVMYMIINKMKENGEKSIITGDGADELFSGYSFLLKKSEEELEEDLKRIAKIMHFPSKEIGKALNVSVETPFLDQEIIDFAKTLPIKDKVGTYEGKKYGKWIIRKTFEENIPKQITWREKSPMQDGSGTAGLTNLFDAIITNEIFEEKKKAMLDRDDVIIRSKESLYYYETYRKYFDSPNSKTDNVCPYCKHEVKENSKFCRMCGSFPI